MEHTVKSFEEEMRLLESLIVEMIEGTATQIELAVQVLDTRDEILAEQLISADRIINQLQDEVNNLTVKVLATRQPMANDLRMLVSVLKIVVDLERVGDYAASIGKLVPTLNGVSFDEPIGSLRKMAEIAINMLMGLSVAYKMLDAEESVRIWYRDDEIDTRYQTFLKQVQSYMIQSPEKTNASTGLLFMGRNLERVGDHLTNVAENVFFIVTGESLLKTVL